ncbi:DNA polymerase gamma 1, partial [Tremellales sp. Uapishka_1]
MNTLKQPLIEVSRFSRRVRFQARPQIYRQYAVPAALAGSNRAELSDYQESVEMAQARKVEDKKAGKRSGPKKRSKLPSLSNLESFGVEVTKKKATAAEIRNEEADASGSEAGPSRSAAPAMSTRKGKEKALDQVVSKDGTSEVPAALQRNAVGVQLLSPSLHSQLFPGPSLPTPPSSLIGISKKHLADHGLSPDGAGILSEISFDLPPLQGHNIRQHFHAVGGSVAEPYLSMAKQFAGSQLPSMPERWETAGPGWTKYHPDGRREAVDNLGDETLVSFDVETLYKISPYAVMATAVTPNAWYSWLSPSIFDSPLSTFPLLRDPWDKTAPDHLPHDLIPLFPAGSDLPRVVIGHNVGYDRARVLDEYSLERTSTRWLDTLSLHVSTRGITSVQRPAWMKHKKYKLEKSSSESEIMSDLQAQAELDGDMSLLESLEEWSQTQSQDQMTKKWEDVTSANSLADVAALHCGLKVDKSIRDTFGDDTIRHASELRPELAELVEYCARDVKTTHDVYQKVLPLFLESCPHPATFAGVLAMGNSFLPVDENWEEYLKNAEAKYQEMNLRVRKALVLLAEKVRKEGKNDEDPWTSQLDWTPKAARWADNAVFGVEPSLGAAEETSSVASAEEESSASEADLSSVSDTEEAVSEASSEPSNPLAPPIWYSCLARDHRNLLAQHVQSHILPILLRVSYKNHPVVFSNEHFWCFRVPHAEVSDYVEYHGAPVELGPKDEHLESLLEESAVFRIGRRGQSKKKTFGKVLSKDKDVRSDHGELLQKLGQGKLSLDDVDALWVLAEEMKEKGREDEWGRTLDWKADLPAANTTVARPSSKSTKKAKSKAFYGMWPKWYWELASTPTNDKKPFGELDLTTRKSLAPLLLRMQWHGYPLVYTRAHRWVFKVPRSASKAELEGKVKGSPLVFDHLSDIQFAQDEAHNYYRLPHRDGEHLNVGNPLSKTMAKYIENGALASETAKDGDESTASAAVDATNMNVLCSYWISSRERIMSQMVVYKDTSKTRGMILPQVITMGTVTRRAVESTWLTASNSKKDRVGSELKSMVRAPPGYAIVGADVDSEELWIASVMGDSQFGLHGATAIGWMTLEGTKSAGTDLHSKTARILGISRDGAKVFNYSRIYGAGKKHAVLLLLQGDATLSAEAANKLADDLYKSTKGTKARRGTKAPPAKVPYLWHGGTESYLFNTLETVALNDRPTTPALGCGVTRALRKSYLDEEMSYLPSRINWVVQSSGVDYLHLLIVSMEYLLKKYDIKARYLISVHDEVRYLAEEADQYRTALALQIANAWTRALFCFNLGMDDVPQGVTFFSAVDVDHVLRKEVYMDCVTPSHPTAIRPGESLDIMQVLEKTNGGDLGRPIELTKPQEMADEGPPVRIFENIRSKGHEDFLRVQAGNSHVRATTWLANQPPLFTSAALPGGDSMPVPRTRMKRVVAVPVRRDVNVKAVQAEPVRQDGSDDLTSEGHRRGWDEAEMVGAMHAVSLEGRRREG